MGANPEVQMWFGAGTVHSMRFDDATDVTKNRKGLEAAIRAWIRLKSA